MSKRAAEKSGSNRNAAKRQKASDSPPPPEDAHASYTGLYDKLVALYNNIKDAGYDGDAQWIELRQRIASSMTILEVRKVCSVCSVKWANASTEKLIDSIAKELFAERLPSPVEASFTEAWVEAGEFTKVVSVSQPAKPAPKKGAKKASNPLDQAEVGQPSEVSLRLVRKELIGLVGSVKLSSNQTAVDVAACKAELVAMRQICGGFLQAQVAFAEREKELLAQIAHK